MALPWRKMTVPNRVVAAAAIIVLSASTVGIASGANMVSPATSPADPQQFARYLLVKSAARQYISSAGLGALAALAGEKPTQAVIENASGARAVGKSSKASSSVSRPVAPHNVRVTNPSEDTAYFGENPDASTQSETTEAMQGNNLVVGFNDSQQLNPDGYTNAFDLTGYAFSSNGGATFTDEGALPNGVDQTGRFTTQNFGDPWIAHDVNVPKTGPLYFGTMALQYGVVDNTFPVIQCQCRAVG